MRAVAGVWVLLLAACSDGGGAPDAGAPEPRLEVVGHSDLLGRGMNAAAAIAGDRLYVGSRTEGETHDDAGVLIVDISDPSAPQVVGAIGPPEEALLGMTSRELRAVPDKGWLVVMNFACSTDIHACTRDTNRFGSAGVAERDNFKIFDISDPAAPELLATQYVSSDSIFAVASPHEMFLWRDPADADRILLFMATPIGPPSLQVFDISDPGAIERVAAWHPFSDADVIDEPAGANTLLHSVTVTDDGALAFLSMVGGGLILADTGEVAAGTPAPRIHALTTAATRIDYSPPNAPGTHCAVPIPGRPLALVTDEVYPVPVAPGCPWGWMRLVDFSDPSAPTIAGEYKLPENDEAACAGDNGPTGVAYTAHNPTVTENLALITWHAGGLQVVDTTDPAAPVRLAVFDPVPLPEVAVEDPALGGAPVAMWSYPIIRDGLIYVIDIRNGLYVLRYEGPYADQIAETAFREGNSNLR